MLALLYLRVEWSIYPIGFAQSFVVVPRGFLWLLSDCGHFGHVHEFLRYCSDSLEEGPLVSVDASLSFLCGEVPRRMLLGCCSTSPGNRNKNSHWGVFF